MIWNHISLAAAEDVALVTLRRPEVRNALSGMAMIEELICALEEVEASGAGALVLTGEGKAFSAGGNVKDMAAREGLFAPMSAGQVLDVYRSGVQRLLSKLYRCEVVTIAAVNGAAVGAGLDLALACDLRYCAPDAVFSAPFVSIGLVPGDGGIPLLAEAVGRQRAAELLFTGRRWDAGEARRYGVVLDVVHADELLEHAMAVARDVAAKPRQALHLTKRLLRLAVTEQPAAVSELSAAFQAIAQTGQEHQAAAERLPRRG